MIENKIKDYAIILNMISDFRNLKLLTRIHTEFSRDRSYSFLNLLKAIWHVSQNEKIVKHNGGFVVTSFLPPIPSEAFSQVFCSTPRNNTYFYEHTHAIRVAPISVHIAITNKCKFSCWHCSNVNKGIADGMETDDIISLISDLQNMGVAIIGLTGGEPLLREEIENFISAIDKRSTSTLFTTGYGLDFEKALSFKKAGLFMAAISLDHYDKKVVDEQRGFKGAFEIAIDAIKNCKKVGIYTVIQTVLKSTMFENNCEQIWKILDFAKEKNVDEVRFLEPICTGKLIYADDSLLLTAREREKIIEIHKKANWSGRYPKVTAFAQIESKEIFGCGAGSQHSYIDAQGNLYPCDFVPFSFGNVKETPVKELWKEMNRIMGIPRNKCFMLYNLDKIRKVYKGNFPLEKDKYEKICESSFSKEPPDFYNILGGTYKKGEGNAEVQ